MPPYKELRGVLDRRYSKASPEQIERMMESYNLSAEDMEDFLSTLGNIGRGVVSALPQILPAALPLVGTAFGGPVGGMLGGVAGQALGSLLSPGQPAQQPQPSVPRPQAPPTLGGFGMPAPAVPIPAQMPGASPAAGQLLQTMFRPETLQALISMLMGQAGRQNIPVGNTQVPVGAFTNLLSVLANQAAAEYDAGSPNTYGGQRYFENYAGEAYGDPAVPEHRAGALLELFRESDPEQDEAYSSRRPARHPAHKPAREMDETDEMYDAMDLSELYSEYEFS